MKAVLVCLLVCAGAGAADSIPVGGKLDAVRVQDLSGKPARFSLVGTTTAIVFLSAQCPVSNEYNGRMSTLFQEYSAKGVHLLFVNANRNESNQAVEEHRQAAGFPFHVYRDRESTLAGALGAEVTPQAFVFDRDGVLRYKGYIDDARNPARVRVQGLRNALDAVMAGKPVARPETKAFGCTIKRRKKVS